MTASRFATFPSALTPLSRTDLFGAVPVLLCHPDPELATPAPTVLWLHGRTANKELDPGRYLRWVRSGIAACAIDLPFHGSRTGEKRQAASDVLDILGQSLGEIDGIVRALSDPRFNGAFDTRRLAIGGMSLGGMVALRRLCEPHPFLAAAVEGTTGDIAALFEDAAYSRANPPPDQLERLNPIQHLDSWRPVPLLALHSEADAMVPVAFQRRFIEALRARYLSAGADPAIIDFHTWPTTGAPREHVGFGQVSNEAKNMQVEFLRRAIAEPGPGSS